MKITSNFTIIVICSIFAGMFLATILGMHYTKKVPEKVVIIQTHLIEKSFSPTETQRILTPTKD